MGGEVGAPAAHLGGLSVRKGRRRGWGLAPGPGPLPQVRGVRAHDRRSGKSHQKARSFWEGGFCSGRKICSARKANNSKWRNCLCLKDIFFIIQFQFELKDMKRRQDEDMMRQQDLIDKQKEQARYGLLFPVSRTTWLTFYPPFQTQRSARLQIRDGQHQGRK